MIDITKIDEKKVPIPVEDVVKDTVKFCSFCLENAAKISGVSPREVTNVECVDYGKLLVDAVRELNNAPHLLAFSRVATQHNVIKLLASVEANAYIAGRIAGHQAGYKAAQEDDMRLMLMGAEEGK